MMKRIEVELTMQEIANIIAGINPPITEMFKLEPEDGSPLATFVYTIDGTSIGKIWIRVDGEIRNGEMRK